jgi:hypothetical protein
MTPIVINTKIRDRSMTGLRMEIPHKDTAAPNRREERRPNFTFALSAAHVGSGNISSNATLPFVEGCSPDAFWFKMSL